MLWCNCVVHLSFSVVFILTLLSNATSDTKSPSLVCPANIHETADAYWSSTRVYWTEPVGHDDRDGTIKYGVFLICMYKVRIDA